MASASHPASLDSKAFAKALAEIVDDNEFRAELERKPGSSLRKLGFDLTPATVATLDEAPISEHIKNVLAVQHPTPEAVPVVIVFVAVQVAVNTRIHRPQQVAEASETKALIKVFREAGVTIKD